MHARRRQHRAAHAAGGRHRRVGQRPLPGLQVSEHSARTVDEGIVGRVRDAAGRSGVGGEDARHVRRGARPRRLQDRPHRDRRQVGRRGDDDRDRHALVRGDDRQHTKHVVVTVLDAGHRAGHADRDVDTVENDVDVGRHDEPERHQDRIDRSVVENGDVERGGLAGPDFRSADDLHGQVRPAAGGNREGGRASEHGAVGLGETQVVAARSRAGKDEADVGHIAGGVDLEAGRRDRRTGRADQCRRGGGGDAGGGHLQRHGPAVAPVGRVDRADRARAQDAEEPVGAVIRVGGERRLEGVGRDRKIGRDRRAGEVNVAGAIDGEAGNAVVTGAT